MTRTKVALLAGALALASAVAAYGGGFFTNGLPVAGGSQYPNTYPLTGNETVPADTNLTGGAAPQSEAITTTQLANLVQQNLGGVLSGNFLIGGDATTNLFQRGTTGSGVTTTVTYGGPDRWAYWSGASTSMTVSRDSTAADLPTSPVGYKYGFKMARTNSQTGVVPLCMAQEIESINSYALAGQVVELDFHAIAGSGFSAANSQITAYVISGTGTDEGMTNLAFGLNGGGGGASGWTGQANATAAVVTIGTSNNSAGSRYTAVATIPATASEVAVALCYTPVGTASSDYVAFSGIQLVRNPTLSAYVNTTAGYASSAIQATGFIRRSAGIETALQNRYYVAIAEGTGPTIRGMCSMSTVNTVAQCFVPIPIGMRVAPTTSVTSGFAIPTTTAQTALTACTLIVSAIAGSGTQPTNGGYFQCTSGGTTAAVGLSLPLMDNGGSGVIKFSAEL